MNIMSFKLKISGEITWGHSLEALFNQFNNVVFSSSRKSVPTEACKHLFGGQMGSIQDYYMANSVLGKSLGSDWFFFGQDFAVRTISMETVQPVYFCLGAKPANSKFATKRKKL